MANSFLDATNQALTILGDNPIVALTDTTPRAVAANALVSTIYDGVLRAHPWTSASFRATLALTSTPSFGWTYAYDLTTTPYCLRVLGLNDDQDNGDPGSNFKIEAGASGRKLMTDDPVASIRFIGRVTDLTQLDSLLYQAFIYRLAASLAFPITGSTAAAQGVWQLYLGILKEARTIDGMEGTPDDFGSYILTDVR
jgi:hypothetical protein